MDICVSKQIVTQFNFKQILIFFDGSDHKSEMLLHEIDARF